MLGLVTDEDFEDVATETGSVVCGEPIPMETCLFCNKSHPNLDDNLTHMSLKHGFFIVDAEYCTDIEGLVTYFGEEFGSFRCFHDFPVIFEIWCENDILVVYPTNLVFILMGKLLLLLSLWKLLIISTHSLFLRRNFAFHFLTKHTYITYYCCLF